MSLAEMEMKVEELIKKGEIDAACQSIFDQIKACASKNDLVNATAWREKLIELDPTQLALIFDSEELIKSIIVITIDPAHKAVWKDLYNSLTEEEGNLLYSKLVERELPPGKVLIQQGKLNNAIFFIDDGQLKTTYFQGEREIFFNNLEKGDTAGQDTFFNISICTTTVATLSPAKIRYLRRSSLQEMENTIPGISKKLAETCSWLESKRPNVNLHRPTHERRQHERHKASAKITAQTFDKDGEPIRPMYSGWLSDISIGGAAIVIDYSDKTIGRSLLGRKTGLSIRFEKGSRMDLTGLILGVKHDNYHAYTLNLKFSKHVESGLLTNILARNSRPPMH